MDEEKKNKTDEEAEKRIDMSNLNLDGAVSKLYFAGLTKTGKLGEDGLEIGDKVLNNTLYTEANSENPDPALARLSLLGYLEAAEKAKKQGEEAHSGYTNIGMLVKRAIAIVKYSFNRRTIKEIAKIVGIRKYADKWKNVRLGDLIKKGAEKIKEKIYNTFSEIYDSLIISKYFSEGLDEQREAMREGLEAALILA